MNKLDEFVYNDKKYEIFNDLSPLFLGFVTYNIFEIISSKEKTLVGSIELNGKNGRPFPLKDKLLKLAKKKIDEIGEQK